MAPDLLQAADTAAAEIVGRADDERDQLNLVETFPETIIHDLGPEGARDTLAALITIVIRDDALPRERSAQAHARQLREQRDRGEDSRLVMPDSTTMALLGASDDDIIRYARGRALTHGL